MALLGLSATLNSIWAGPRASEFSGIWQSRHLLRVRDVQATLREAAVDLRRNAAEQHRVSHVGGRGRSDFASLPGLAGVITGALAKMKGLQLVAPGGSLLPLLNRPEVRDRIANLIGSEGFGDAFNLLEGAHSLLDIVDFIRHPVDTVQPFYNAVIGGAFGRHGVRGLADLAMNHAGNQDDWFAFYKDGLGALDDAGRAPLLEHGTGLKLSVLGAAISGGSILHAGFSEGFGSSEFVESLVDDGISAAVGFVPGGGIAYAGGKFIGDQLWHHTPIGEAGMRAHASSESIRKADAFSNTADQYVREGDFEAAQRASERATEESRRALEQSEGFTGLGNATLATVKSLNPFSW